MSTTLKIPPQYQAVMPYLILKDAAKFISFMKHVFDAEETLREMRDKDTIMHAEITVGGCTIMMADSTPEYGVRNTGLFIYVPDADTTYQKALENGATPIREVADQEYGRSGGFTDPFGNTLWVTAAVTGSHG